MSASSVACPLCEFTHQVYLFARQGTQVFRCANCGLVSTRVPARGGGSTQIRSEVASPAEQRAADLYVAELIRRQPSRGRMLPMVESGHPFLASAAAHGFSLAQPLEPYDCAVVLYQLETAPDPLRTLEQIHGSLTPGGVLLIVTPSLDSWRARVMRSQWPEWLSQNRYYFDTQTIQSACARTGFAEVEWSHLPGSAMMVSARKVERRARPLLSIVMPVFNERATFERTLAAVREKECEGVDKEIVIVESRSTDGTRELVQRHQGQPGITVILEDRPRGKGAAVRTGLKRATGTIVLIQDADDEYDVNDYDALLEPILTYRSAFVLGSRHMGSWKVRKFADQPAVSAFFNVGHVLFRTALNVLYRQTMDDPFTMYKVFRRDCLHRLKFECNRFDFDFELVIKLVRKGYVPLEIPVNYVSRSFHEGKKVSAFRDPLTWIRALVKYRFASIWED